MKKQLDSLGNRMKNYEAVFNVKLQPRMITVLRLDGKAFHTYTRGLNKPFDKGLVDDMISTTKHLCESIQGCKLGYVQSDEISLVLTDFDDKHTQAWFNNEVQKILSISASICTEKFNNLRIKRFFDFRLEQLHELKSAHFDSRVFQFSSVMELGNYLLWRQQDCVRNSISSCAQSLYSDKELHRVDTKKMQELIFQKSNAYKEKIINCGYNDSTEKENYNWNDLLPHLKRGMSIFKQPDFKEFSKEIYDKDRRTEELKNKDGWVVKDNKYYKKVMVWSSEAVDYEVEVNERIDFLNTLIPPM